MDTSKPLCKCCGHPVDYDGTDLCEYCYHRSGLGCSKYIIMKVILDNGNVPMTINEITDAANEFRKSIGVEPITPDTARLILKRYSKYYEQARKRGSGYLLIVGSRKVPGVKKPLKTFKLSVNLVDRVGKYEKRWKNGLLINMKNNKGDKWHRKTEHVTRARAIYLRVQKGEIGLYDFMLWDQKTNTEKAITLESNI